MRVACLLAQAGEFLEALKLSKRALEAYVKGNCYFKAVRSVPLPF